MTKYERELLLAISEADQLASEATYYADMYSDEVCASEAIMYGVIADNLRDELDSFKSQISADAEEMRLENKLIGACQ